MDITYERQHLSVDYNLVWILDGFDASEDPIFHSLSVDTGTRLKDEGYEFNISHCRSRAELMRALIAMRSAAQAGTKFAIHFFCHGGQTPAGRFVGLMMGSALIPWSELTGPLAEINEAMGGDLILIMTVCGGLHGIKSVVQHPYPFFGLFGPKRSISVDEALEINKDFYQRWFAGEKLNELVNSVNATMGEDIIFPLSAEGYQKIRDMK